MSELPIIDVFWMPIETAPKDGTVVLAGCRSTLVETEIYVPESFYQIYDGNKWCVVGDDPRSFIEKVIGSQPTHWKMEN